MEIGEYIELYKSDGYVKKIRKSIGHAPLIGIGCGVIVENDKGEILLQKRKDNGCWAIIGGTMELGESVEQAVKREAYEEAGIEVDGLQLFGIYSGKDRFITYPNGDICYVTGIIFKTRDYKGDILQSSDEALAHHFFRADSLPDNLNLYDELIINDWLLKSDTVFIH